MKAGKYNKISDVKGVRVGHYTLNDNDIQTGVTVLMPVDDDIFQNKCIAGCHVINGFGKTSGLVQLEELGTLESPIALTNTLSVGTVQQALVKYMIKQHPDIGRESGTINTIVGECNDGYLNDIRACAIQEEHVYAAIADAKEAFACGAIGAGRGMSCFEYKGGIGSASRIVEIAGKEFTIGALVLSNFGLRKDFLQEEFRSFEDMMTHQEQGSIIMILATDIPLSQRQCKRVCKRMPVALARLGSHMGHGSGDIAITFSTANRIPQQHKDPFLSVQVLHEGFIDLVFRGAIEACEAAIIDSLQQAETVRGRNGHIRCHLNAVQQE